MVHQSAPRWIAQSPKTSGRDGLGPYRTQPLQDVAITSGGRPKSAGSFKEGGSMSVSKIFDIIKGLGSKSKSSGRPSYGIPTVKFDASRLTKTVKADIRK